MGRNLLIFLSFLLPSSTVFTTEVAPAPRNVYGYVLSAKPAVIDLPLSRETNEKIASCLSGRGSISARIVDVVTPSKEIRDNVSVYVFLNKPDATAETSAREDSFVHAFGFSYYGTSPLSYSMDLTYSLKKQIKAGTWSVGSPLLLTLLLLPFNEEESLPKGLEIPFKKVTLDFYCNQ